MAWRSSHRGQPRPARVFIGYARADEEHRATLQTHLAALQRDGLIDVWHEGLAQPGEDWESEARTALQEADLALLLLSADFVGSKQIWDRVVVRALQQRSERELSVVPLRVRSVEIGETALAKLASMPHHGPPLAEAPNSDAAWAEVAGSLRALLRDRLRADRGDPLDELAARRGRELLARTARIARLRAPDANVAELSAPEPFDGLLLVTSRSGRAVELEPIGVVDGPITAEAFDIFRRSVEAPYRHDDPLLRARIVHTGAPASDDLFTRARRAGVLLEPFSDYQSIVDFDRYLHWQTDRIDRDPHYPERLYVDQRAEVRIRLDREQTSDALSALVELLTDPYPRFILVLGDFGTGKTFLMRQLARRLAARHDADPTAVPAPVLVEMRALEKSLGLDKLLAQHFQLPDIGRIPVDAFRYLLSEGRAALLFDGFDELAFRVSYDRVIEHFETVLEAAQGRAKVIITSRTAHFLTDRDVELVLARRAAGVEGYRLVKLRSFDEPQIHRALVKRLGHAEEADRRMTLLREIEDLMGLSSNPRMLGFILELPTSDLEEAKTRRGKITSATLYELLVTKWLEGEMARARPRGAEPPLGLPQLWRAVIEFALLLWPRTEKGLFLSDIPESLWASLQALDPDRPLDVEQATQATGSRSLLVRDEEGRFSFWHESILDWLVARAAAADLIEKGQAPALYHKSISDLMADFFGAMAGRERAIAWAREAFRSGNEIAVKNAERVLKRLGAEREEDVLIDVAVDLSGQDLRGQDFSGTDHLRGAMLDGADLSGATLAKADLSGASLRNAKMVGLNAERAKLRDADLSGADLSRARLLGADLRGAKAAGSRLRYARLLGAVANDETLNGADTFGAAVVRPSRAESVALGGLLQDAGALYMGLAVSPDGALLAAGYGGGTIVLWDLSSGYAVRAWNGHAGQVTSLMFSVDGQTLASGSDDTTVKLWNLKSGNLLRSFKGHSQGVMGLAISADSGVLASASDDNAVNLWDLKTGELLRSLEGHPNNLMSLAFSADGKLLVSGSDDGTLRLWDLESGRLSLAINAHSHWVLSVAFSHDSALLASGSRDKTIKLWDARSGMLIRSLTGHLSGIPSVAFAPDGKTLASGSDDKSVILWDVRSGKPIGALEGHSSGVRNIAFSADGRTLASGSYDETIKLWDWNSGKVLRSLEGHFKVVRTVTFSPDGGTLVSGSNDQAIRLWDIKRGRLLQSIEVHGSGALSVAFCPDGEWLGWGCYDKTVKIWSMKNSKLRWSLEGHSGWVRSIAFSPDRNILASGSEDETVKLWDLHAGQLIRSLAGHSNGVLSVAFSPDSTKVASGSDDKTIKIWEVKSGRLLQTLEKHWNRVLSVSFSPDGDVLASGSEDGTVKLWRAASGELYRSLDHHSDGVRCVAFSPNGETLASGSGDRTIKLCGAKSGTLWRTLEGHTNGIRSVAFSPDGELLASASRDGTIRLWRVADGTCLAVIVPAEQGWAAYTPDGRYKVKGDVGGRFWHVVGLCRFEPGELDEYVDAFTEHRPLRLHEDEPLW